MGVQQAISTVSTVYRVQRSAHEKKRRHRASDLTLES